jgi:predicted permease
VRKILIQILINSFLPVSLLILLGYFTAKKTIFQYEDALSIIKYIGVIAVPALTLNMTVSISFANINWLLISSYIISELVIYLTAIFIAKYFFNLKWNDTILIGMASSFANHLLFVYPIALNEYGPELIDPIKAIIGFDVIFLVINLIILEFIKFKNLDLKKIILKQF